MYVNVLRPKVLALNTNKLGNLINSFKSVFKSNVFKVLFCILVLFTILVVFSIFYKRYFFGFILLLLFLVLFVVDWSPIIFIKKIVNSSIMICLFDDNIEFLTILPYRGVFDINKMCESTCNICTNILWNMPIIFVILFFPFMIFIIGDIKIRYIEDLVQYNTNLLQSSEIEMDDEMDEITIVKILKNILLMIVFEIVVSIIGVYLLLDLDMQDKIKLHKSIDSVDLLLLQISKLAFIANRFEDGQECIVDCLSKNIELRSKLQISLKNSIVKSIVRYVIISVTWIMLKLYWKAINDISSEQNRLAQILDIWRIFYCSYKQKDISIIYIGCLLCIYVCIEWLNLFYNIMNDLIFVNTISHQLYKSIFIGSCERGIHIDSFQQLKFQIDKYYISIYNILKKHGVDIPLILEKNIHNIENVKKYFVNNKDLIAELNQCTPLLKDIDFEINKDKMDVVVSGKKVRIKYDHAPFIVIEGHTGSGKSTIFRFLTGFIQNSYTKLNGVSINDVSYDSLNRIFGYILQDDLYNPHIFLEDIISLCHKFDSNEEKQKVYDIAKRLGITNIVNEVNLKRRLSDIHMSGGQKKRLSILLLNMFSDSAIHMLDEPFSKLDLATQIEMRDLVVDVHNRMNSIFIVIEHMGNLKDVANIKMVISNNTLVYYVRDMYNNWVNVEDLIKDDESDIIEITIPDVIVPKIQNLKKSDQVDSESLSMKLDDEHQNNTEV